MAFYDFKQDLAVANKTEKEIAEFLVNHHNMKLISFNNDNKYDLLLEHKGRELTVEIKEDFTCARTGNIGVEYSCRGKASGIEVSEAMMYCYKVHLPGNTTELLMMLTPELKGLIADKKYFRTVNGGDIGSNSLNYLFKLDVIRSISHSFGDISALK